MSEINNLTSGDLDSVQQALQVVQDAGFDKVPDVLELCNVVAQNVGPVEGLESEYQGMSGWARTPNKWREATASINPVEHVKLSGQSEEEMTKKLDELEQAKSPESHPLARIEKLCAEQPELSAAFEDSQALRIRFQDRLENVPQFSKWYDAMDAARAELICCGDPTWKPETFGCGASTFFEKSAIASSGEAKWPEALPPLSNKRQDLGLGAVNLTEGVGPTFGSSRKVGEVLSLHIGADGCGMGAAMWERLLSEHCIGEDGLSQEDVLGNPWSMFSETAKGRMVPRAVFASDESTVLGGSKSLQYISPDCLIAGATSDAEASWSLYRQLSLEREVDALCTDALRRQAEKADAVTCLLVTHSMLDAFGGGFTCNVLENSTDLKFKILWDVGLVVSPAELEKDTPLGCKNKPKSLYNTLLSWQYLSENCSLVSIVDNTAMGNIAQQRLGNSPSLADCYCQVGQVMSAITSSLRIAPKVSASEGTRHLLPKEAATNLIPYPRINTIIPSLAPRFSKKMMDFSEETALDDTVDGISDGLLASVSIKAGAEEKKNKIVSAALYFRNYPCFAPAEVVTMYQALNDYAYVDWAPARFSCATHRDPSLQDEGEIVGMFNTTAVGGLINQYSNKYKEMSDNLGSSAEIEAAYKQIADDLHSELVSWMDSLVSDYIEVSAPTPDYNEDDEDDEDEDE